MAAWFWEVGGMIVLVGVHRPVTGNG